MLSYHNAKSIKGWNLLSRLYTRIYNAFMCVHHMNCAYVYIFHQQQQNTTKSINNINNGKKLLKLWITFVINHKEVSLKPIFIDNYSIDY